MTDAVRESLAWLPDAPGVYMMIDANDEVIYVGKAISLKKRVRSYFTKGNHAPKVRAMVAHVARFEYILVDNEVEALVLESNLIKEKKPRYNILLRDDKQYPYILITDEPYPRLLKVRRIEKDAGEYFGPFPNAYAVNDLIELMGQIYPLRTCNLNFARGDRLERPCLNYFIGRCKAPCIGIADENEYNTWIESIRGFLRGRTQEVYDFVDREMKEAAAQLQFEVAARWRDLRKSAELLMEKQTISTTKSLDVDLLAMARGDRTVCVQVFLMRSGKIVEREHFLMEDDYKEKARDLMAAFITQYYMDASYVPNELLVDTLPTSQATIEAALTERRGTKVTIRRPQRGDRADLLATVRENAQEMLTAWEKKQARRERTKPLGLEQLEQALDLPDLARIECFDISNVSGAQSVGSMIVYEDGKKANREYRKFKLRTTEGPDDVQGHREVVERRLKRLAAARSEGKTESGFGRAPDLLLIDGGKGQVNAVQKVVGDAGLRIPVCGLVKDEFHNTRGLIWQNEELALDVRTPLYRFVYEIQEEAHRFAIGYHRSLRSRALHQSVLDEIPGIGPVRRNQLLSTFKTIPAIQEASEDELAAAPGMNRAAARNVRAFFDGGQHG